MEKGREKDPVVVDIPEEIDSSTKTEVWVHPIPTEQQCNIMKMSSYIRFVCSTILSVKYRAERLASRGIVLATNAMAFGMRSASDLYIAKSKPREQPLVFSERTNRNVQRLHTISGKAVQVTAKTTSLVHDALEKAVDYVSGDKNKGKGTEGQVVGSIDANGSADGKAHRIPLKARLLMSTDMLLTTVEQSARDLIEEGTNRLSKAMDHKRVLPLHIVLHPLIAYSYRYGNDMGNATRFVGESARNVGLVYIDARGIGRRALLKKAGKRYIRAKLGKKDVILGVDTQGELPQQEVAQVPSALERKNSNEIIRKPG